MGEEGTTLKTGGSIADPLGETARCRYCLGEKPKAAQVCLHCGCDVKTGKVNVHIGIDEGMNIFFGGVIVLPIVLAAAAFVLFSMGIPILSLFFRN